MELTAEFLVIESEFKSLKSEAQLFSKFSKSTVSTDQTRIKDALTSTIGALRSAHLALTSNEIPTRAGRGERRPNGTDGVSVRLSKQFQQLDKISSEALQDVCEFCRTTHEIRAKLKKIELELEKIAEKSQTQLNEATEEIQDKRNALVKARVTLNECRQEMGTIERKAERNGDKRTILRVGRVAAWGAGLVYPPLLLAAAGMEFGAQ